MFVQALEKKGLFVTGKVKPGIKNSTLKQRSIIMYLARLMKPIIALKNRCVKGITRKGGKKMKILIKKGPLKFDTLIDLSGYEFQETWGEDIVIKQVKKESIDIS